MLYPDHHGRLALNPAQTIYRSSCIREIQVIYKGYIDVAVQDCNIDIDSTLDILSFCTTVKSLI